ncbi:ABC transporter substrate-binding protein [Sphingomonas colocasiae]|uniref:ABC transporter substrate-binding protein n=1 Tax=Sphingomonas colocasiae TaxID=1848973 RepID=A0ABS7PRV8_9SPHN|nr:ABC transporter substrate-binding protein [Sphingomonas colocasiae]MBY8824023.1 ABC transporter substrate-binding protein [Sphingomonas colocasiae]
MTRLDIVIFAGASNWPLWIAQHHGLFAMRGLDVRLSITPGSAQMARDLFDGTAQIALTAFDNVIAYAEGHGAVSLPETPDFFAFAGFDNGLLSLVGAAGFDGIEALRGQTIAVDALTTGFAFVLRALLADAGLGMDDYRLEAVGGGAQRLEALIAGRQAATLLNSPLDMIAAEAGCTPLRRARDVIGPYQGIVGAARRGWAQANPSILAAFVHAMHDALAWLADPANRDDAVRLLREKMPRLDARLADRAYEMLVHSPDALTRSLEIDRAGAEAVLDLRRRHGGQAIAAADSGVFIDQTIRDSVLT